MRQRHFSIHTFLSWKVPTLGSALLMLAATSASCLRIVPITTSTTNNIGQVSAGFSSTCAIYYGGLECWGSNQYGQLGVTKNAGSSTQFNIVPAYVTGMGAGTNVQFVSSGGAHTCAVINGGAWCWGRNLYGELGNPTNQGTSTPNPVPLAVTGLSSGVKAIYAGSAHTCALLNDGSVQCWGFNYSGQLWNTANNGTSNANYTPLATTGLAGSTVSMLALGSVHSCALLTNGSVQCAGRNYDGELGNNTNIGTLAANPAPPAVSGLGGIATSIAVNQWGGCALLTDSSVQCWGGNFYGQLGTSVGSGTSATDATPITVNGFSGPVISIMSGNENHCALLASGVVECWGDNNYGEMASPTNCGIFTPNSSPVAASNFTGTVSSLGTSEGVTYSHCAIVGGALECWGNNSTGQLATTVNLGASTANCTPYQIPL